MAEEVELALSREAGKLGGYRSVCRLLRQKHHLVVTHELVRLILKQTDPVSVSNRRQHRLRRRTYTSLGPNYRWHVDGYDKLRPYGILISGCIDDYSRKSLWLKAAYSNHKPSLIASYFVDCVENIGGYPARIRTDCGTENVVLAAIQCLVTGTTSGHLYGSSPGNQRIEGWWSFFRRHRSQWWIELFESLVDFNAFHPGNAIETEYLRYCFMGLVQQDLDEVRRQWNTHRIRPSTGSRCPAGIPDELFYQPQSPYVECMITTSEALPNELMAQLEQVRACEDEELESYFTYLCQFNNFAPPHDVHYAVDLYFKLTPLI